MLVILTGPPGAGKSTVGDRLAHSLPRSVNFSLDDLRHFVKGGYVDPWNDTDEEGQSVLATSVAIEMIKKYQERGFVVIIDDVFDDEGVRQYQKYFDNVFGFVLLPSLDVLRQRDSQRDPDKQMGERSDEIHAELLSKDYKLLRVVDSSEQTVDETVAEIRGQLGLG